MSRAMALVAGALIAATPAAAEDSYAFDDIVYLSCAEAWATSGESTEEAVEMIRVLTKFSLSKRELVVPEDKEDLSAAFGDLIRAFCTADPDGLLYNAVDKAIRRLL